MNECVILYHQMKRKKHKIKLVIATCVFIIIALMLLGTYLVLNKKHIIKYKENSKVNYKINLLDNEFYKNNYVNEGIDIIASLIKNINIEFNYKLELQEELEYIYSYKILAQTQLREKSKTNVIYENEEMLSDVSKSGKSSKLVISEKVNVDYDKFNNQMNKLIKSYKLTNTTSELYITLYLNVINKMTGEQINKEKNVMAFEIPLTTKTVEATVKENVKDSVGEIIIQENYNKNTQYFLITGLVILFVGVITFGCLIKYILRTRSAEKIYEDELKKILFDYKSYIQKINNPINYEEYKVIKIDTLRELLEMKEELQAPILMYTEQIENRTTFMIINSNLLFMYVLEAREIREKLIEISKERKMKKRK